MVTLRILLADDDSDYRRSIRKLLDLEGFRVQEAASVRQAEKELESQEFDLVLADLRLTDDNDHRDISGFRIARKALENQLPCVVITAFDTVETTKQALVSLGADPLAVDYVPKRDGPKAILNAIRRLHGLTLLHISDLHPKVPEHGEVPYDQEQAYAKFRDDQSTRPGLALNPVGAILVSGDVSFQCRSESFDWTRRFLENLAHELSISLQHIVLAPGNHDIDRTKAQNTEDTLRAMRVGDPTWFMKFDEYLNFTRFFYGEPAFSIEKLYRLFTLDHRVAIAAFNSCLVEGDARWRCSVCLSSTGKEHYCGWIDRHQVRQAGEELDEVNWTGLRIALLHHHVSAEDWHPQHGECQGDHLWTYHHKDHRLKFTFFDQGFRIVLHGHRHKGELRQSPKVGSKVPYHFGSGAFWMANEKKQETANYLLLQLSPLPGRSRVVMRRYYPATDDRSGYWGADGSIEPEGIIPLPGIVIPALHTVT